MRYHFLIMLFLLSTATIASAETVYVIDKLLIGMHAEPTTDSPVVKVLATASQLEVVARDDTMTQVRDADGVTGWVETDYLMADIPDQWIATDLRRENEALRQQLAEQQGTAPDPDQAGIIEQLTRENADLRNRITTDRIRVSAQEQPALESARRESGKVDAEQTIPAGPDRISQWRTQLSKRVSLTWLLGGSVILLLLGFTAGAWLMDWLQRRRHGGFRI